MNNLRWLVISFSLVIGLSAQAEPLGTAFTYQGELIQSGTAVTGMCDFNFGIWDAEAAGSEVANSVDKQNVAVNEGVFSVELDFGGGVFDDQARWLEIAVVCPAGGGGLTQLTPRQELTATPYALQAQSVPDGSITATQIDSTSVQTRVTGSCAVGNVVRAINADGSVVCEPDTNCSLSACTNSGHASLTCGTSTTLVNCQDPGSIWTARSAAEANSWRSVTYDGGLFVAVAPNGGVMTSPDGITWTARSAAEANAWVSVTYGDGLFVAVAETGTNRVMTSPDGIIWTAQSAAEANQWTSVTYGGGQFVAVAQNGTNRVMTSPGG